jgi:hypothetical protein
MNKTKMKINRRKSKTRNRNKTKKFKGGGFFNSIGSFFKSNISPTLKDFLKLKTTISDDIQKVYDANNKAFITYTISGIINNDYLDISATYIAIYRNTNADYCNKTI